MKDNELLNQVRVRAGLADRPADQRATLATLDVLGQRLTGNEPADFAAQLPGELQDLLTQHAGPAEDYGPEEFVRRVAEHHDDGTTAEQASQSVRVVLGAVGEFVSRGEVDDLRAQLPSGYEDLLSYP